MNTERERVSTGKCTSLEERSIQLSLVLGGDTSLGDTYIKAQNDRSITRRLLESPTQFYERLYPLISDKDFFVLNFEGVLTHGAADPWNGKKKYIGIEDPDRTLSCLKSMGVDAVSLANNHTFDYGAKSLTQMIDLFESAGIATFGAGANSKEAIRPITIPTNSRTIYIFSAFEYRRNYSENFECYATANKAGVQRLTPKKQSQLASEIQRVRRKDPTSFIIVYPHWGGALNYKWATQEMFISKTQLIESGADIIIGHGAHMMQECWIEKDKICVFSLGNFLYNSPGRYQKKRAIPYSLVARLIFLGIGSESEVILRLYPILSDNRVTNYSPRPVTEAEASEVYKNLSARGQNAFSDSFELSHDKHGFFIGRKLSDTRLSK